ncbi:MAG: hypothetical protein NTZ43_01990 [Gemmatimonadetes bacterium]|nr:hypothetical protein [Gemmatimonadota bacterium]
MRILNLIPALGGIAVLTIAGCAKATATATATPAALTVVQGNLQAVQGGKDLPQAVILRVTDKSGAGIIGQQIALAVTAGGGAVDPASAMSDAKGEVKAKWTVGNTQTEQELTASAPGVASVRLTATAILPTDIIVAQGNNQTAKVGTSLTNSIVVRVVGPNNVPMQGITVAFQIISGGGAISPASAITSALGEVTAKWTLGAAPGVNLANIVASTASNAVIVATGAP